MLRHQVEQGPSVSKEGSPGSQERLERSGRVVVERGSSRGAEVGTSPLWTDARWGGRHAQEMLQDGVSATRGKACAERQAASWRGRGNRGMSAGLGAGVVERDPSPLKGGPRQVGLKLYGTSSFWENPGRAF